MEFPKLIPREDVKWEYECVPNSKNVSELSASTGIQILQLSVAVTSYMRPTILKHLNWISIKVYGTENFFKTINASKMSGENEYMPVAELSLLFKESQEILLLSDYEADKILKLFWISSSEYVCLINFADLRMHLDDQSKGPLFALSMDIDLKDYEEHVAAIQMFNGETTFGVENENRTNLRQIHVKRILGSKKFDTRGAMTKLVYSRELGSNYSCSDLEKISFQN